MLNQSTPKCSVDGGRISGAVDGDVAVFRGIPFAAPLVGERRWRAPQPVVRWEHTRICDSFGPSCPQAVYPSSSIYREPARPQSEDCLYLNVWAPREKSEKGYPVMVWVHGGALTRGSGGSPFTLGRALAKMGVVVVTFNYRLGVFGFFAHPELSAESANGDSGNYAFLDQVAALRWVQQNIAAFGGDPECVTLFGESAGSWSVAFHLASPLSRGLFHRAIGQSGILLGETQTLESAEQAGVGFQERIDVAGLTGLRKVSAHVLLQEAERGDAKAFRARPNVDGYFLKAPLAETFEKGSGHPVPLLVGSNADECTALVPPESMPRDLIELRKVARSRFGAELSEFERAYRVRSDDDVSRAFVEWQTDEWFTVPTRRWAELWSGVGNRVFAYFFDYVASGAGSAQLGAYHAAEIGYIFQTRPRRGGSFGAEDNAMMERMSRHWVEFAKSGDPNLGGEPTWPSFSADRPHYFRLGESCEVIQDLLPGRLDFQTRFPHPA